MLLITAFVAGLLVREFVSLFVLFSHYKPDEFLRVKSEWITRKEEL